ncbi:MAG: efflux RND transporter periplasmic adaptor subunit [Candidatus Daviesbacteria bacterium]
MKKFKFNKNSVKNFLRSRWYLVGIVLVIIAGIFILRQVGPFKISSADKNVRIVTVTKSNLSTTINASGEIKAEEQSTQGFLTSGRVAWVGVKEGDKVSKWQALASLDSVQAEATFSKAEANLKSTQTTLEKILDDSRLWHYGNKEVTVETQTQKTAREQAEMARDAAYQDLQSAQKNLEWSSIIAPFDGIVSEIKGMSVGQNITPGSTSFITLTRTDSYRFMANVDEIEFANLSVGQKGEIILDAFPSDKFNGVITKIGTVAVKLSTGGSVIPVELSLDFDKRLKSGLNGEVNFMTITKENVFVLPKSAIHKSETLEFVYVSTKDKPVKKNVNTGESLGNQIEITSGLSEGEKVVLGEVKL